VDQAPLEVEILPGEPLGFAHAGPRLGEEHERLAMRQFGRRASTVNSNSEHHVATHTAEEAYEKVLADVGCNRPALDKHDQRVINEVRTGTASYQESETGLPGLPDTQSDIGGWDDDPKVHRPRDWDGDGDGLPNHWETRIGLDPDDVEDGAADPDRDGYTNLEDYLNWLAAGGDVAGAPEAARTGDGGAP
jgi:hypothetical protein